MPTPVPGLSSMYISGCSVLGGYGGLLWGLRLLKCKPSRPQLLAMSVVADGSSMHPAAADGYAVDFCSCRPDRMQAHSLFTLPCDR